MSLASRAHRYVGKPLDAAVRRLARPRVDHLHAIGDLQLMLFVLGEECIEDNGHLVVFKRTVLREDVHEDIACLVEVATQTDQLRPCVDDVVAVDEVVLGLPLPSHAVPPSPCADAMLRTSGSRPQPKR